MSICYFVCGWSGKRHNSDLDNDYNLDRTVYLRRNLGQLERLRHNLDEIVIGIPENKERDEKFSLYLEGMAGVFRTINKDESYGAFRRYLSLGIFHDYYIFIEDDYYFVQDNFDSLLIKDLNRFEYACSLVWRKKFGTGPLHAHPAISNGIMNKDGVKKWLGTVRSEFGGQIGFGIELHNAGVKIKGLSYKCPFWSKNVIIDYNARGGVPLMVPYQYK